MEFQGYLMSFKLCYDFFTPITWVWLANSHSLSKRSASTGKTFKLLCNNDF